MSKRLDESRRIKSCGFPSAARSIDKLKEISASLADPFIMPVDMTKPDEVRRMVQKTHDHHGRLDVLINNARRGLHAPIAHIDLDDFGYIISLNVYRSLVAKQSAIPIMRNMAVAPQLISVPRLPGPLTLASQLMRPQIGTYHDLTHGPKRAGRRWYHSFWFILG